MIQRIVRLILDRNAARKTEEDAKKTLGGVDEGLKRLKRTAAALGAAIVAAFGLRAIIQFGRAAINAAKEETLVVARLASAVDNAGGSFADTRDEILGLVDALEDATGMGGFEDTLSSLIGITGDVEASLNNVGLVANVAAQFFGGDMTRAAQLLGRTMYGEATAFRRYGIAAESAQEVLELLATRTMGAAERSAQSFGGRVNVLNELWIRFQEALGYVLIGANDTVGILDVLTGVVRVMIKWVGDNEASLRSWIVNGFHFLVAAVDGTYRGIRGLAEIVSGTLQLSIGVGLRAALALVEGFVLVAEAAGKVAGILGFEKVAEGAQRLRDMADAAKEVADTMMIAGAESIAEGARRIVTSSVPDFSDLARAPTSDLDLNKAPMLSSNIVDDEASKEALEKQKALADEAKGIWESTRTAAEKYMETLDILGMHLDAGRIDQETYNRAVADAVRELRDAQDEMEPARIALEGHAEALIKNANMARLLGDSYNALEQEESLLLSTMQALIDSGVDPMDERLQSLVDRLGEVREGFKRTSQEAELTAGIASATGDIIGAAMGGGIGALAAAKAKQNAILAAEHLVHAAAAALGIVTSPLAGGHLAVAAKYAAMSAAWGGFSAVVGAGGGGGGGGLPSIGRDATGRSTERTQAPGAELHITFIGEGFNAVNPIVQDVVMGSIDNANERIGPNARVHTYRRNQ
jgi:hypothetical protein